MRTVRTADPTMRCPLCEKDFDPAESKAMPFCSDRCKTIDLGRWLDEGYSMPQDADPDSDAANDWPFSQS